MLKNYLKTALRNLLRYKGFTIISVSSLTIGITGCLVIGLFVWDELKYDKFIKDGDNVYRIYNKRSDNVSTTTAASVPPMFAPYIQQQFPEVATTNRTLMASGKMLFEIGDKKSYEDKWLITEGSFFNIFPLKFIKGESGTALATPGAVVITEKIAEKYFGNEEPIGKVIRINKGNFQVNGVLANLPEHFHLEFDFLMSLASLKLPKERMESWEWQQFFTYIKVKPGTNALHLQDKFKAAVKKQTSESTKKSGYSYEPFLQPLRNIHLQSADFSYDNAKRGNLTYVRGLTIIALFVLIIACFNFINLATARSLRRAKEIGVRKVIGADRKQLVFQFTGESVLLSVLSMIIATIITIVLLPSLNSFTGKHMLFKPVTTPLYGLLLLAAGIAVGILAGLYPAIVLSGFQPIKVLKGMKSAGDPNSHTSWLRQALVIIQFALSALLIVCTTIVYQQINYMNNKDLGFNKEQIMYFSVPGGAGKNIEAFKDELKRSSGIVSATAGYGLPGDQFAGDGIIVPTKEGDKQLPSNIFITDPDYITTLSLQLVAGRDFSRKITTDAEEAFIINETAVKELGFDSPDNAIGQRLKWEKWNKDSLHPYKEGRVIGVVKDFHYKSLHEKVTTTILLMYPAVVSKMAVKLKTADIPGTIAAIHSTWNKFSPDFPLDYKFMDESFEEMYKAEKKLSILLWTFTLMAIFVGCMGLFGLATFSAEQRKKEISVRKVLGASFMNIVTMLAKKFLKPVLLASIIAFPIAWWAMNSWLENFPYRVSISWWIFGIAGTAALVIALITVSFQSIKAATSNPIKNLRTE